MRREERDFEQQIGSLWDNIKGYHAVHVVATGDRLGLFKALKEAGDEGRTAAQMAAGGLHPAYVETWCNTAASFCFVDVEEGPEGWIYYLAPHFDNILASPGDPRHLANYCTMLVDHLHADLDQHAEMYKTGAIFSYQDHGAEFTAGIAGLTGGLQAVVARNVLPKLPDIGDRLADGIKHLDMGCGTAGLMRRLAKAYPEMTCHGVDVDAHGIDQAEAAIAEAGLSDRISVELVDGGEINHEDEFDLVTMFEVLHELPLAVRPQVLANCAKALKPGGKLLIIDETYPEKPDELRKPEFFFSVMTGFNELTWGNVVPTRSDQDQLLGDAGLTVKHRDMLGGLFTLILAEN